MDFDSGTGLRLRYWFTTGVVVTSRSWTYRNTRYHKTWIRDGDGREQKFECGLLGVDVNQGQRLALAWCAPNGAASATLVAVRNCTTGEHRVLSQTIAAAYVHRTYWQLGTAFALLLASAIWQGGYVDLLPSWVSSHWVLSLLSLVAGGGIIGSVFGHSPDPDPHREVDRNIHHALKGMEDEWRQLSRHSNTRRRSRRGSQRRNEYGSDSCEYR